MIKYIKSLFNNENTIQWFVKNKWPLYEANMRQQFKIITALRQARKEGFDIPQNVLIELDEFERIKNNHI